MGGHKFEMVRHQIEKSNVDIFSLSESWLTEAVPERVPECMNYDIVRLDKKWNDSGDNNRLPKRGGGLACYIKSNIKYSDTKYEALNKSCKDLEMLWVSIEIKNLRPILIVTIYRPPQGDHKKCNELLTEAFERANLKDNTDIFMLGDFNIDLADRKNSKTKDLEFTTGLLGLRQLVNTHTRVSFRNGIATRTKLDLIFSNSDCIAEVKTLDYNISDHLTVAVVRKKSKSVLGKISFEGRSYKNYVKKDLQQNLTGSDWTEFYGEHNPTRLWDIMEENILKQANLLCPMRFFRVKEIREPWITNEAIEAIRDKDKLLNKAKKSGKETDWAAARMARNNVGRDLENLRVEFLKNQQEINKNDPKKFWSTISSIYPGKKGKSNKIWLKNQTTGTEIEQAGTANFINSFFTNIGKDLAKQYNTEWK